MRLWPGAIFASKELSTDEATRVAVLHCCEYLDETGCDTDLFLLLQPTSPIRGDGRVDEMISSFISQGCDSMLSVSRSHRFAGRTW